MRLARIYPTLLPMSEQTTHPIPPHEALRADIHRFCEAHGMTKTAFGIAAISDPGFVAGLDSGREPRWSTIQKVRGWMAEQERGAA